MYDTNYFVTLDICLLDTIRETRKIKKGSTKVLKTSLKKTKTENRNVI